MFCGGFGGNLRAFPARCKTLEASPPVGVRVVVRHGQPPAKLLEGASGDPVFGQTGYPEDVSRGRLQEFEQAGHEEADVVAGGIHGNARIDVANCHAKQQGRQQRADVLMFWQIQAK